MLVLWACEVHGGVDCCESMFLCSFVVPWAILIRDSCRRSQVSVEVV